MKKIILGLLVLFSGMEIVLAANHTLSFKEEDNQLFYDTTLLNKDAFLVHTDMVPGKEYKDELIIENNSNREYVLYLKAQEREQSKLSDELLDNIMMKIYLGDQLIYNGKAKGLDYEEDGVNLQESINLGNYKKGKTQVLKVETMLNPEYSNIKNPDFSYIDWLFYARYQDEVLPINPNTGDYKIKHILEISICSLFIILLILLSLSINKKYLKIKNTKIKGY